MFLKLGRAKRYCVPKGNIFFRVLFSLFLSDISNISLRDISVQNFISISFNLQVYFENLFVSIIYEKFFLPTQRMLLS